MPRHRYRTPQPVLPEGQNYLQNVYGRYGFDPAEYLKRLEAEEEYRKLQQERSEANLAQLEDNPWSVMESARAGLFDVDDFAKSEYYSLKHLGAGLLGETGLVDEETIEATRQDAEEAAEALGQAREKSMEGMPHGGISDLTYEGYQMLPFEGALTFASGGVGAIGKKVTREALKKEGLKQFATKTAPLAGARVVEKLSDVGMSRVGQRQAIKKQIDRELEERIQKIGTRISMGAVGGGHGARASAGTYREAQEAAYKLHLPRLTAANPDLSSEEVSVLARKQARRDAIAPAILSGTITAALITAFGATGVERMLANPMTLAKSRPVWKELLFNFNMEATEEGLDQFFQGMLAKYTYDKTKTPEAIINDSLHAMLLGGLLGVKMSAIPVGLRAYSESSFYKDAPITTRLANWMDKSEFSSDDRERLKEWYKKNRSEMSPEEIDRTVTSLTEGVARIQKALNREADGATKDEADAEARKEQQPTEEKIDELKEEGKDTTLEEVELADLDLHRGKGKAAASDGNPDAVFEEAGRLDSEVSPEASEAFLEGYNAEVRVRRAAAEEFEEEYYEGDEAVEGPDEAALPEGPPVSWDLLTDDHKKQVSDEISAVMEDNPGLKTDDPIWKPIWDVMDRMAQEDDPEGYRKLQEGVAEPEEAPEEGPVDESEFVSFDNRIIKIVDVNGVNVPFYLSTGEAGKEDVPSGKWYPVIGMSSETGWLNKKGSEMGPGGAVEYYGSPELRAAAENLDDTVGDIKGTDVPRLSSGRTRKKGVKEWTDPATLKAINFINDQLGLGVEPLTQEQLEAKGVQGDKARAKLRQNINTVVDAVKAKPDRVGMGIAKSLKPKKPAKGESRRSFLGKIIKGAAALGVGVPNLKATTKVTKEAAKIMAKTPVTSHPIIKNILQQDAMLRMEKELVDGVARFRAVQTQFGEDSPEAEEAWGRFQAKFGKEKSEQFGRLAQAGSDYFENKAEMAQSIYMGAHGDLTEQERNDLFFEDYKVLEAIRDGKIEASDKLKELLKATKWDDDSGPVGTTNDMRDLTREETRALADEIRAGGMGEMTASEIADIEGALGVRDAWVTGEEWGYTPPSDPTAASLAEFEASPLGRAFQKPRGLTKQQLIDREAKIAEDLGLSPEEAEARLKGDLLEREDLELEAEEARGDALEAQRDQDELEDPRGIFKSAAEEELELGLEEAAPQRAEVSDGGQVVFPRGLDKTGIRPIEGTHKTSNVESLAGGFQPREYKGVPVGISIARHPQEEQSSPTLAEPRGTEGIVSVTVTGKGLDYTKEADRKIIDDLHEESRRASEKAIKEGAEPGSPGTMVSAIPGLLAMGVDWVNGWNSIGEGAELHVINPEAIQIKGKEEGEGYPTWELPEKKRDDQLQLDVEAAVDTATDPETTSADNLEPKSLDLFAELKEKIIGEDRAEKEPPEGELPLKPTKKGEEREEDDIVLGDVPPRTLGKEAPPDKYILSAFQGSRTTGTKYYKNIGGYEGNEYEVTDMNYRGGNEEPVVLRHNAAEDTIDLGFYDERGEWQPTHRLRDESSVKRIHGIGVTRAGKPKTKGFHVSKNLLSKKTLINEDVWEHLKESPRYNAFQQAKAEQVSDPVMVRRVLSNFKNPLLKARLEFMRRAGNLGVESVNSTIRLANKFRKQARKREINPAVLSSKGDIEGLAKAFEESLLILSDAKNFRNIMAGRGGRPRTRPDYDPDVDLDAKEQALLDMLADNLEPQPRLTRRDLRAGDKGRVDESIDVVDHGNDNRALLRGYSESKQEAAEVRASERILAPLVSDMSGLEHLGPPAPGRKKLKTPARRVEIEVNEADRIPTDLLIAALKKSNPGLQFEITKLRPGVDVVRNRPRRERLESTQAVDEDTGKEMGAVSTKWDVDLIGRDIPRVGLRVTGDGDIMRDDVVEKLRATIYWVSKEAEKAPLSRKWLDAKTKEAAIKSLRKKEEQWLELLKTLTPKETKDHALRFAPNKEQRKLMGQRKGGKWTGGGLTAEEKKILAGPATPVSWWNPAKPKAEQEFELGVDPAREKVGKSKLDAVNLSDVATQILTASAARRTKKPIGTPQTQMMDEGRALGLQRGPGLGNYLLSVGARQDPATQARQKREADSRRAERKEPVIIEHGHLDAGVTRYSLGGQGVYIRKSRDGFAYKTQGSTQYHSFGNKVKTQRQAEDAIIDVVNEERAGTNFSALSTLIARARDLKGQELQQGVPISTIEEGPGIRRKLPTYAQEIEEGAIEEKTPGEKKGELKPSEKDEEAITSEEYEAREKEIKRLGVAPRWRTKKPTRVKTAPLRQKVFAQEEGVSDEKRRGKRTFEKAPSGEWIQVPIRLRYNNEWRTGKGLPRVKKIEGKWHTILESSPLTLTEREKSAESIEQSVERGRAAEEEEKAIKGLKGWMGKPGGKVKTAAERSAAHRFPTGPKREADGSVEDEADRINLSETELDRVRLIIESFGNIGAAKANNWSPDRAFLEAMHARLETNEDLWADLVAFAEAGKNFKPRLNRKGRLELKEWAKRMGGQKQGLWEAVLEHAEDIYKFAETSPKKLRAKSKQRTKRKLQVPNNLPTAKGAVALKELVNRTDNGLTSEQRANAIRMLDTVAPELLEKLSLNISSTLNRDGDTEVETAGEFNTYLNLINLAGDAGTDPDVLMEEIAHFTAKLLPDDLRNEAIDLHRTALDKEIAASEKAFKTAKGPEVLQLTNKLNILRRIKSSGQLTSDEYRAALPKMEEVGEAAFASLIEDTYHLANADEFYANGIVTRVGESTFDRGRRYMRSLLDGIKAYFSTDAKARLQAERFITGAVKAMSTKGRGNRGLGSLLMRGNVVAKSMRTLTTPSTLAGSLATDITKAEAAEERAAEAEPEQAARLEKDAAKHRAAADTKIEQAGAITSTVQRLLRKFAGAILPGNRVYSKLSMLDGDYISSLVHSLPSINEYSATIQKFHKEGNPELAQATALYAYQYLKQLESNAASLRDDANIKLALIKSDDFKIKLKKAVLATDKANILGSARGNIKQAVLLAIRLADQHGYSEAAKLGAVAAAAGSIGALQDVSETLMKVDKILPNITRLIYNDSEGRELFHRDDLSERKGETTVDVVQIAEDIYKFVEQRMEEYGTPINKNDKAHYRVVSAALAADVTMRRKALSSILPDSAVERGHTEYHKKLIAALESKDDAALADELEAALDDMHDLSTAEGQARYAAGAMLGAVREQLEDANAVIRAANIADNTLNDPEMQEYRMAVAKDSKAEDRPFWIKEPLYDKIANGVVHIPVPPDVVNPDKPEGNIITVRLMSNGEGTENIITLRKAAADIQNWLEANMDENGRPTSPFWEYYWNTLQQINTNFINEMVWNAPDNTRSWLRSTFFGVLDHLIANTPTRGAQVASRFIERHNLYYVFFDKWRARYQPKWRNLLIAAAKSRPGKYALDTRFDLHESKAKQKFDGIQRWEREIGRPLRDSWQENGMNYGAGDFLPNGKMVTKEDMALLEFEFNINKKAFAFNEEIADRDASFLPSRVDDILNTKHIPLERGKMTFPRKLNEDGRQMVNKWYNETKGGKGGKGGKVGHELFNRVFSGHIGAQALISFMSDRNSEWITGPGKIDQSINERAYSILVDEISQGQHGESPTSEMIITRLASLTTQGPEEAKAHVMEEMEGVFEKLSDLFGIINNEAPFTEISNPVGFTAHSPFADARKEKVAPGFFYSHGFNTDTDFTSFALQGSAPAGQNVANALESAATEIDNMINKGDLTEMEDKIIDEGTVRKKTWKKAWLGTNPVKSRYDKRVQRELAKQLGITHSGSDLMHDRLLRKRNLLKKYAAKYKSVFGGGESHDFTREALPNWGERLWSTSVGGVLMSMMTTIRNLSESAIHGALMLSMMRGQTGAGAFAYAMVQMLLVQGLKLSASGVASGVKVATGVELRPRKDPKTGKRIEKILTLPLPIKMLANAGRKAWGHVKYKEGFLGKTKGVVTPHIAAAARGLLTPLVEEIANVLPRRTDEYRALEEADMDMPVTPEDTAINYDEFAETGGRIIDPETHSGFAPAALVYRSLKQILGQWEGGIALLGRPIFPRLGDVFANNVMGNLGQQLGHEISRKAKYAYLRRVKAGVSMDEEITPEEILGSTLGIMKQNGFSWNEARAFISKAGVTNIEEQVRDFWKRLAAAPDKKAAKKETLFDGSQMERLGAIMIMANNMATPSNRPIQFRESRWTNAIFALMGWPINAMQNWLKLTAATDKSAGRERGRQRLQAAIWFGVALGYSVPENWLLEWLMRGIDMGLYGKRRITALPGLDWVPGMKGVIQSETAGGNEEIQAYLALAVQSIPIAGSTMNAAFNDKPGRVNIQPGNLLFTQAGAWFNFINSTVRTKDFPRAVIHLAHTIAPMSKAITYRVSSWQQGAALNTNAERALGAGYGDQQALKDFTSWRAFTSEPDEFNPVRDYFRAAVALGDWEWAREQFETAVTTKQQIYEKTMRKKLSRKDALKMVRQSLRSADVISRKFKGGKGPTRAMLLKFCETMTPADRDHFFSNVAMWEQAFDMFGLGNIYGPGPSTSKKSSSRGGRPKSQRPKSQRPRARGPRPTAP